jgi:hypothetical protein
VHEVPLLQSALLPLDDEQRLAREDEEVLLLGLPVVRASRAFMTNQPLPAGTSPASVSSSLASGTIVGSYKAVFAPLLTDGTRLGPA